VDRVSTFSDYGEVANGSRILDIGGLDKDCEDDEGVEGKNLVIMAIDPGTTTGWSALKVPVGRLASHGVSRTLSRCRWRHGQILRSMVGVAEGGPMALSVSDSRHVDMIQNQINTVYEEMVFDSEKMLEDGSFGYEHGWEDDVFVLVLEGFRLRILSMDDNLLAPQRVLDRLCDRLYVRRSRVPVFFQTPSEAMSTVTDARLKDWAMYDRHSGEHARDADRHAILFLRKFADNRRLRSSLGF
jgi:hypothetical protein